MLEKYLKKYRFKNNLSQHQMARRLQTSQTYYCLIETGKKKPGHTMVRRIAETIGVSEAYIIRLAYEDNK